MAKITAKTGDQVLSDHDNINEHWPYLELHEEAEVEMLREKSKNIEVLKDHGEDWSDLLVNDYYKVYRMRRFLDSIIGFHKGSLDFSGRHKPRHAALSKRWTNFIKDYNKFSAVVKEVRREVENEIPRVTEIERWMLIDDKIVERMEWTSFARKWDVSHTAGYLMLKECVDGLMKELEKNPNPKFQELCLLDLPVEIIDHIFSFASPEKARLLASTCHKLREIGKSHTFISRSLTLDLPRSFWEEQAAAREQNSDFDMHDSLVRTIRICRSNFLREARFLFDRPDLMDVVGTLWVGNHAMQTLRETGVDETLGELFFRPIFKSFIIVIQKCRDLRALTLSTLDLSAEILDAVLSRRHLVTLDLRGCDIPQPVIPGILDRNIRPSSSILNLVIMASTESSFNSWVPVALCSNLRNLAVTTFNSNGLEPSSAVSRHSKAFATLEKLFVGPVSNIGLIDLIRWIELNAAKAPLRLTHLKMSFAAGIEGRLVFQLLDVLESAPLQVLVLEGIQGGSLELFDSITAKFPQLLGLTITIRQHNKAVAWPFASYEYASHFSGFQKLEHFGWNFRVPIFDQTPAGIRYFEEGFISEGEKMRRRINEDDYDYFMDAHYVAYPFAAHCPTLKSFAIVSNRILFDVLCYIHRKPSGEVELVGADVMKSLNSGALDRWDIPLMALHWPHVVPKGGSEVNT